MSLAAYPPHPPRFPTFDRLLKTEGFGIDEKSRPNFEVPAARAFRMTASSLPLSDGWTLRRQVTRRVCDIRSPTQCAKGGYRLVTGKCETQERTTASILVWRNHTRQRQGDVFR